jgi:hypothetical protein
MNCIYRVVFNAHRGAVMVTGENARISSKSQATSGRVLDGGSVGRFFAGLGMVLLAFLAYAVLLAWFSPTEGALLGTIATGVAKQLKYKVEGTWGVVPAASGSQRLRRVSSTLNLRKQTVRVERDQSRTCSASTSATACARSKAPSPASSRPAPTRT